MDGGVSGNVPPFDFQRWRRQFANAQLKDVIQDWKTPQPGPNEVLAAMRAAPVAPLQGEPFGVGMGALLQVDPSLAGGRRPLGDIEDAHYLSCSTCTDSAFLESACEDEVAGCAFTYPVAPDPESDCSCASVTAPTPTTVPLSVTYGGRSVFFQDSTTLAFKTSTTLVGDPACHDHFAVRHLGDRYTKVLEAAWAIIQDNYDLLWMATCQVKGYSRSGRIYDYLVSGIDGGVIPVHITSMTNTFDESYIEAQWRRGARVIEYYCSTTNSVGNTIQSLAADMVSGALHTDLDTYLADPVNRCTLVGIAGTLAHELSHAAGAGSDIGGKKSGTETCGEAYYIERLFKVFLSQRESLAC